MGVDQLKAISIHSLINGWVGLCRRFGPFCFAPVRLGTVRFTGLLSNVTADLWSSIDHRQIWRNVWVRIAAAFFFLPGLCFGQTKNSYPMLMSLKPTAAQIGATTEHELSARYNLAGASTILVSGTGVSGEVLPNEKEKPEDRTKNDIMSSKCMLRFHVAADAIPGVRDFRIFTPHGVSTMGQLVIGRDPVISESAENNTREQSQSVILPATICGAIEKAEDVDWFKFKVEQNSEFIFHVRAQRLLNRMHDMQTRIDPLITLRDAQGVVLASSDNVYAGDPLLHFQFKNAGDYFLEVRDVRYQGNIDWVYSIEINSRPFVTQVSPPVLSAGQTMRLRAVGFNLANDAWIEALVPESDERLRVLSAECSRIPCNEFFVFVAPKEVPIVKEQNTASANSGATDGAQQSDATASGTIFSIPAILTGTVAMPGEVDRFQFEAKAKDKLSFEVFSRRLLSDMDPKIRIVNEKGGTVAEADDGVFQRVTQADPWLENWTVPADGKYSLEIQDLHQRGSPGNTYAVQVSRSEPYFLLEADTDKTLLAPGMGGVLYVRTLRKNGFAGEIQLGVDGLPQGVTATCGRIPPELNDGIIYFEADTSSLAGAKNIQVIGTGTTSQNEATQKEWSTSATVLQEYYSPGGGRGHYPVEMHTISVANPVDIRRIQLSDQNIKLKPGESKRIDVEIERAPDFKGNVTLDVLYQHLEQPHGSSLPKGVTVDVPNSKTLLTGADNRGHITLKVAADAPNVVDQLVPVNVHISINFVMKHTFCTKPLRVTVER